MATRPTRSRRAALTLLELLLALAVVSALAVLIASAWSQARRWSADLGAHHRSVEVARTLATVERQWAARRALSGDPGSDDALDHADNALAFLTAEPLLFPGWPLVAATYTVETDEGATPLAPRYRLRYTERRVLNPSEPELDAEIAARPAAAHRLAIDGRPILQSVVLLAGCTALAVERLDEGPGDPAATTDDAERAGPRWMPVERAAAPASAPSRPEPDRDEPEPPADAEPPRLFRIVGRRPAPPGAQQEQEVFACVLVARASR